jgi:hypothetical protein
MKILEKRKKMTILKKFLIDQEDNDLNLNPIIISTQAVLV